jgi:hypothetical protein
MVPDPDPDTRMDRMEHLDIINILIMVAVSTVLDNMEESMELQVVRTVIIKVIKCNIIREIEIVLI